MKRFAKIYLCALGYLTYMSVMGAAFIFACKHESFPALAVFVLMLGGLVSAMGYAGGAFEGKK